MIIFSWSDSLFVVVGFVVIGFVDGMGERMALVVANPSIAVIRLQAFLNGLVQNISCLNVTYALPSPIEIGNIIKSVGTFVVFAGNDVGDDWSEVFRSKWQGNRKFVSKHLVEEHGEIRFASDDVSVLKLICVEITILEIVLRHIIFFELVEV